MLHNPMVFSPCEVRRSLIHTLSKHVGRSNHASTNHRPFARHNQRVSRVESQLQVQYSYIPFPRRSTWHRKKWHHDPQESVYPLNRTTGHSGALPYAKCCRFGSSRRRKDGYSWSHRCRQPKPTHSHNYLLQTPAA